MKKIISIIAISAAMVFSGIVFTNAKAEAYDGGYRGSYATSNSGSYANQGQGQGQGQSQSNVLENSGNSAVVFENSFNGSKPIRYLPVASDVQYQGLNAQMFAKPEPDKGENFIPAKTLIDLMNAWAVSEISDEDIDESEIEMDITMVGKPGPDAFSEGDVVNFELKGTPEAKAVRDAGSKPIAIGTIKCTEDDINTAELFMTLVKKAKAIGATNIILLSEGIKIELESSGWGLGFSYNYASVNSDLHGQGSVGAGGTGISGGSASYKKMPYLTFAFMQ